MKFRLLVWAIGLALVGGCVQSKQDSYLACTIDGKPSGRYPATGYVEYVYQGSRSHSWVVGAGGYNPKPGEFCNRVVDTNR